MAISIGPVKNPTLSGVSAPKQPTITGVSSVGPQRQTITATSSSPIYGPTFGSAPAATGNTGGSTQTGGQNVAAAPAPAPPDPYAQWGGKAGYDAKVGSWNTSRDAFYGSLPGAYDGAALQYGSEVNSYNNAWKNGVIKFNNAYTQNELGRQQGVGGIYDMVGHGVRSAGVQLANRPGASTSSAGEAVARAYADIGGREMNKVGNEFAQRQQATGVEKQIWDNDMGTAEGNLKNKREQLVNTIVTDANDKMFQLNQSAVSASLPQRVAIEQEKTRIRNDATARLLGVDASIAPTKQQNAVFNRDQVGAEASKLNKAGAAALNPFDFTTSVPGQFAGTGPFSSDLPLFSNRGRKQGE